MSDMPITPNTVCCFFFEFEVSAYCLYLITISCPTTIPANVIDKNKKYALTAEALLAPMNANGNGIRPKTKSPVLNVRILCQSVCLFMLMPLS